LSEEMEKLQKIQVLVEKGCSAKVIRSLLKDYDGYEISESTIYKYIKKFGWKRNKNQRIVMRKTEAEHEG